MKCPVCSQELVPMDRQGIEIDCCPNCRGVWLDRNELDKIVERSVALYSKGHGGDYEESHLQRPRAPYQGEHQDRGHGRDPHHRPGHKRKSFLEEIFDFD